MKLLLILYKYLAGINKALLSLKSGKNDLQLKLNVPYVKKLHVWGCNPISCMNNLSFDYKSITRFVIKIPLLVCKVLRQMFMDNNNS